MGFIKFGGVSLSSRHTEKPRIVFDPGLLFLGFMKALISPGLSSAPPAVTQSGKFRLGTWTYDEILSGYRANEVANRQDADPMHFVSSVLISLTCLAGMPDTQKPSLRGLLCVWRMAFAQRATLTPSRLANEVSFAVSRKSRMKGASSMSLRMPA